MDCGGKNALTMRQALFNSSASGFEIRQTDFELCSKTASFNPGQASLLKLISTCMSHGYINKLRGFFFFLFRLEQRHYSKNLNKFCDFFVIKNY